MPPSPGVSLVVHGIIEPQQQAQSAYNVEGLTDLSRWLVIFELNDETQPNISRTGQFVLAQTLPLAGVADKAPDLIDRPYDSHFNITAQDIFRPTCSFKANSLPSGNICTPFRKTKIYFYRSGTTKKESMLDSVFASATGRRYKRAH